MSGKIALVIEDMPPQQIMIQQTLERIGVAVITAGDFDTALEQIRARRFNLVTLDMRLDAFDTSGQHGHLLLEELQTFQPQAAVIIISVLEWSDAAIRDFLHEHSVFDYLAKPFRPEDLRPIAQAALARLESGVTL